MFCVFSLDTKAADLEAARLQVLPDLDFFVCPWCSMYTHTYSVDLSAEPVKVLYDGSEEGPYAQPSGPYPRHSITTEAVVEGVDLRSEDVLEGMEYRELWDGNYHMLVPHPLWGVLTEERVKCQQCGYLMQHVAIIDSDDRLGIKRLLPGGASGEITLNWVDDYYLSVFSCHNCLLFTYCPAHG